MEYTEHESALLWGWDRQLYRWFRRSDLLPLAQTLRKRLLDRAGFDPLHGDLHQSAIRGWMLVAHRLARKHAKSA